MQTMVRDCWTRHFLWCKGTSSQCSLHWHIWKALSSSYTRNAKMRIWSENLGHWARCIHTSNSVHNWGHGERSTNFVHWSAGQTCSHTKELEVTYSKLVGWLRCKLFFTILKSAVMCMYQREQVFKISYRWYRWHNPCLLRLRAACPSTVTELPIDNFLLFFLTSLANNSLHFWLFYFSFIRGTLHIWCLYLYYFYCWKKKKLITLGAVRSLNWFSTDYFPQSTWSLASCISSSV